MPLINVKLFTPELDRSQNLSHANTQKKQTNRKKLLRESNAPQACPGDMLKMEHREEILFGRSHQKRRGA